MRPSGQGFRPSRDPLQQPKGRREVGANRLYQILFDGEYDYVEAPAFAAAIRRWTEYQVALADKDDYEWDVSTEPESVTLISEAPVVRYQEAPNG